MLELKDAQLHIQGREMFHKLSVMLYDGQMTCVTGDKGCGKTLLLRVLMGFVPLDSGFVSVDGELLTPMSVRAFRRFMAYIPQLLDCQPSTFVPDMSDFETLWGEEYLPSVVMRSIEMPVVTIQDKPIVLADDPDVSMLGQLRALANGGRTVVVTSRKEEYLNLSDKIVSLGDDKHILS